MHVKTIGIVGVEAEMNVSIHLRHGGLVIDGAHVAYAIYLLLQELKVVKPALHVLGGNVRAFRVGTFEIGQHPIVDWRTLH